MAAARKGGIAIACAVALAAFSPQEPTVIANRTDYRLLLDVEDRIVNLQLPLEHYERLRNTERPQAEEARILSRIIHDHFLDVFDFLIVTFDERQPWVGNDTLSGLNMRVRVVAEGLGLGTRRQTGAYATDGPLASITFLKTPVELQTLLWHELMHTWGQNVLPTDKPAHWGRSSVFGQLGGWKPGDLTRGRDGVFSPRGNAPAWRSMQFDRDGELARPYAPLELYLMGLIPADSVPPVEVAVAARPVPGRGASFVAARLDTVEIDQIVAQHGTRVPAPVEAQRHYRGIVIIVSMLPLARSTWQKWSGVVRDISVPGPDRDPRRLNFWEVTGGRARLQLDSLRSALRHDLATGTELHCSAQAVRDSLIALQTRALADAPRELRFVRGSPTGLEEDYRPAHGYAIVRKLGLTVTSRDARPPKPQLLFYMPVDTTIVLDWSDFGRPNGVYALVGWGYQLPYATAAAPPRRACIPRDAWFVHEAGWHLRTGSMELTPGVTSTPARDSARTDLYYWHGRTLDLHVWLGADGVPIVARENPHAPDRGVALPPGAYVRW